MNELLKQIQNLLDDLPQAQQTVALYVLENYKDIPFLSVTNLAKKIGVSDTTIIKFCVGLGFDGFGSFKKKISEYVQSEVTMYRVLENNLREIEEGNTLDQVFAYDQNNLQTTFNNPLIRENFDKLVSLIESAPHIHIIGFRTSAVLAEYMALTLRQQDRNVTCIIPGLGEYADKLCKVAAGDLLIAFTFSRYSTEVVKAINMLKSKGITCALITDSAACPAYSSADLVLTCATKSSHYSASYVGCFSLMNAIFTATSLKREKQITEHLKNLEDLFRSYHTFYR